jgi:peptide deformylase
MAIRTIELLGSEALRTPAKEVETFDDDLRALVRDMFETMYHAEGAGLAAPQVNVPLRVFVFDLREEGRGRREPVALVNPRIVESSSRTARGPEGCLSIPGVDEVVTRAASVVVEGFTPDGEPVGYEVSGHLARVFQHEIDHLDGVLFIDRISPLKRRMLLKRWQRLREEEASER